MEEIVVASNLIDRETVQPEKLPDVSAKCSYPNRHFHSLSATHNTVPTSLDDAFFILGLGRGVQLAVQGPYLPTCWSKVKYFAQYK